MSKLLILVSSDVPSELQTSLSVVARVNVDHQVIVGRSGELPRDTIKRFLDLVGFNPDGASPFTGTAIYALKRIGTVKGDKSLDTARSSSERSGPGEGASND